MSHLSRRDFLKRTGALIAAAPVVSLKTASSDSVADALMGRAFDLTDIHESPELLSPVIGQLAPDGLTRITALRADWYQVDGGWVQRTALQPILPYHYPDVSETTGFWAETVAPISTVKAWCAAHAPVVARLGFGAMVYVMDRIVDDRKQVWYGVTTEPGALLLGWTPALHHACWMPVDAMLAEPFIRIFTQQRKLVVYDHGKAISELSIYSSALDHGTTTIQRMKPGGAPIGLPWLMQLESGHHVHGAYWHNRFGEPGKSPSIELSTFAARWLYERLSSPVRVVIE